MEEMTISEIVQRLRDISNTAYGGFRMSTPDFDAVQQAADTLEKLAEITTKSAREQLSMPKDGWPR